MVINPIIFKNMSLDPKTELVHVTRLFYLTHVFAVNASLNVKTFDELAALAKSKPKTMNYLTPSLSKVAFMEEFNKKHGIDFVRVPFKGGGDAVNSMMTGVTPVAIFGIGNLVQLIRNGKVVGFAVDSEKRSPLAPDIPTFRELGYTVHVWASSFGIHMPAGTPKPIVDRLNKAIVKIASRLGISATAYDQSRSNAGARLTRAFRRDDRKRNRPWPGCGEGVRSLSRCEIMQHKRAAVSTVQPLMALAAPVLLRHS